MADQSTASNQCSPKHVSSVELSHMEEGNTNTPSSMDVVADTLTNTHKATSCTTTPFCIAKPTLLKIYSAELAVVKFMFTNFCILHDCGDHGFYVIIFAGCASLIIDHLVHISVVGIAVVWAMAVMAMIYTLGHVSGAHFNPAVTIAFAVSRKFPWKHVPIYIGAQVLGSTLATITLHALYHNHGGLVIIVSRYSDLASGFEAVLWEFIITFILMFTICGVATDHRAINELSGVAAGATVLFNAIIAGPITGASMNPARSIGPAIISGNYKSLWVYIVGPTLGAIAATMVYCLMRVPVPDKSDDTVKIL